MVVRARDFPATQEQLSQFRLDMVLRMHVPDTTLFFRLDKAWSILGVTYNHSNSCYKSIHFYYLMEEAVPV